MSVLLRDNIPLLDIGILHLSMRQDPQERIAPAVLPELAVAPTAAVVPPAAVAVADRRNLGLWSKLDLGGPGVALPSYV